MECMCYVIKLNKHSLHKYGHRNTDEKHRAWIRMLFYDCDDLCMIKTKTTMTKCYKYITEVAWIWKIKWRAYYPVVSTRIHNDVRGNMCIDILSFPLSSNFQTLSMFYDLELYIMVHLMFHVIVSRAYWEMHMTLYISHIYVRSVKFIYVFVTL